jgi:hypothetical protein
MRDVMSSDTVLVTSEVSVRTQRTCLNGPKVPKQFPQNLHYLPIFGVDE